MGQTKPAGSDEDDRPVHSKHTANRKIVKSSNRQIAKSSNRQIVKSKKPSREFGTGFFAAPRPGSTAPFPGPFPTRGKGVMGLLF